ncbi:MAG: VWA domain-containing protein [Candidatus Margulisbacteria bacterium]|nr:VWA domain-containing protein [Candidatus Margulisiibacteriota bacterium]
MLLNQKIFADQVETAPAGAPTEFNPELREFYQNPDNAFGQQALYIMKNIVWHILGKEKVTNIRWNNYGQGSYYNSDHKEIRFDPALVTSEEDLTILKFVASHEVSHAVITKYASLLKDILKDSAEIEAIGFSSLCNAIEDPRVNNWAKANYPGAKNWQKATYAAQFAEENAILSGGNAVNAIIQQLGYPPKFVIYQSEVIRYWHTGQFSTKLDPAVQKLLEKNQDYFIQAYNIWPASRDSAEIQRTAKESFLLVYEKIWLNGYKELMAEVKDLEKLNQALQNQNTARQIWDALTEAEKKELLDNMQKTLENLRPEELQQLTQNIQPGQAGKIDPNKLSLELKQKIEKLLQTLSQKTQQQLQEKAEQALGAAEDALNDEYESELNNDKMPRHAPAGPEGQTEIAISSPDQPAASSLQDSRSIQQKIMGEIALSEINELSQKPVDRNYLNKYDRTLMELGPEIDKFVNDLGQILRANEHPRYTSGHDSGQRINMDKAMQFEADPAQYKIFDKRRTPTTRDFKFTILLDMSGSMEGEKIEAAFKGLTFLCEAFHRLNLAIEIIGFDNTPAVVKTTKEPLDAKMRQKLSNLTKFSINGQKFGGGTNDAEAIKYAYDRSKKDPRELSFIIVISDGEGQDLKPIMRKIKSEQLIPLPIGLGLGEGTDYVADGYQIALPNIQPQDLGQVFADLLRDIVENPFKYSGDRHYASNFNNSSGVHFMHNFEIEEQENE